MDHPTSLRRRRRILQPSGPGQQGVTQLPPLYGGRGVHASGKIPGGGVGDESPSPKMRTGQWCTAGRPLVRGEMPAGGAVFPCHAKTGSGRPGPRVKGGVTGLPPPLYPAIAAFVRLPGSMKVFRSPCSRISPGKVDSSIRTVFPPQNTTSPRPTPSR
jgi:hypothetical protein